MLAMLVAGVIVGIHIGVAVVVLDKKNSYARVLFTKSIEENKGYEEGVGFIECNEEIYRIEKLN